MAKLLVANWKLNPNSIKEAEKLFLSASRITKRSKDVEILICPPAPFIDRLNTTNIESKVKLGAQDCFWEEKGAYTGEVSAPMLKKLGASYVIIGHSERRRYKQETDEMISKKVEAALKSGLKVILCVRESLTVRAKGLPEAEKFVADQLAKDLAGLPRKEKSAIIIAYEPIWAIGTGRAAKPKDAVKMAKKITDLTGAQVLYGGSTDSNNLEDFIQHKEIYGALVGGASIKAEEFKKMIKIIQKYV